MKARVLGFANVTLGVWDGGTDSPFYWINVRDPLEGEYRDYIRILRVYCRAVQGLGILLYLLRYGILYLFT